VHETIYFGDQEIKGMKRFDFGGQEIKFQCHESPKINLKAWRRNHSQPPCEYEIDSVYKYSNF